MPRKPFLLDQEVAHGINKIWRGSDISENHVTCSVARVYRGASRSAYWKPDKAGSRLDRRVLDKPVQHDKTLCKDATFVAVGVQGGTGPLGGRERQT
jgi:hypothetical protein